MTKEELGRRKIVLENEVSIERNGKKAHKDENIAVWQALLDDVNIQLSEMKDEQAATIVNE